MGKLTTKIRRVVRPQSLHRYINVRRRELEAFTIREYALRGELESVIDDVSVIEIFIRATR